MKTIAVLVLLNALFCKSNWAQSHIVDKGKLTDFFQSQQFEEAINYLQPVMVQDSNNLQLLGFLGYAYYMNDDIPIAAHCYQKMLTIDSNNQSALRYLTSINIKNNPTIALEYARRLVNRQPSKAAYKRTLGDLLRRMHEKDSALLFYNSAYELAPNDQRNAGALADALIDDKSFSRADSILAAGLARDSLNLSLLKLRIRSAYETKDYPSALSPGEKLIAQHDISLGAMTQLVLSYYNLKKYRDCIRVCEYLLTNEVEVESIYYYEAKAWAKLDQFVKSNELLHTCLVKSISKTAELYYYNLGENYESLKQYKKAVAQYDTAYYLFRNPIMYYNCGRICESNLKNMKLAKKYYTLFLKIADPKSSEEKKAYAYVKSKWGKR
ncbi:MAG TPA: tetratricopeptide repeat protein [Puia sp.]|nr:tetratricopeptide repeat protein [Puia sp.]